MAKDKISTADIEKMSYHCAAAARDARNPSDALAGALSKVGETLGLDRCLVMENESGDDRWSVTAEWTAEGVGPAGKALSGLRLYAEQPGLMRELSEKGALMTKAGAGLPVGFGGLMTLSGAEAAAVFPVENAGAIQGVFIFESCRQPREWSAGDAEALALFTGAAADLLRIKWLEAEVRDGQMRLRYILDEMELIIHVKDIESDEVLLQNRRLEELAEAGVVDFFSSSTDRRAESPLSAGRKEFFVRQTGRFYRKNSAIIPWRGDRLALLEYAEDITDMKNHQDRLERYALLDMFTGTYNRSTLVQRLGEMLEGAHKQKLPVTVAFVDIDDLKVENDRHGHAAGDELIQTVVSVLRQNIRTTDLIGRYGGDEFIVAFYSCPMRCASDRLAAAQEQLAKIYRSQGRSRKGVPVGFSYGLAQSSEVDYEDTESFTEELILLADRRMFEDKNPKKQENE